MKNNQSSIINQQSTTLRPMWDARKGMWKIAKKTFNGSGGWARFGGKFYTSRDECEDVIYNLVCKFPDQYAKE